MDGFVIFIIVFFLVFVVQGFRRKTPQTYTPEKVSQKRVQNWAQSQMGEQDSKNSRPRATTSFAKANQAQMTARAARRGVGMLEGMDAVRDPHDKNRHRRSDWGSRAGPGILSLRNTAILIAAGLLLLWVFGSMPVQ